MRKEKKIKHVNFASYCGNGIPIYIDPKDYSIQKDNKIALIFSKVVSGKDYTPIYISDTTEYLFTSIESYGADSFVIRNSTSAGIWVPDDLYVKISFRYDDIEVTKGLFQNLYLHKYKVNGKLGLLDIDGNIICEAKYYSIWFDNDERSIDSLIKVEYDPGKFGYIDFKGNEYF